MLQKHSCQLMLTLLLTFGPFPSYMSSDPVTEGEEGYIDPFDMENFQHPSSIKSPPPKIVDDIPVSKQMPVRTTPPVSTVPPTTVKSCSDKPDSKSQSNILFRNYVKFLLGKFRGKLVETFHSNEAYLIYCFKAAEIQQQTVAMKDAPAECVRDNEDQDGGDNWFSVAQSAFRGLFTFEKDNCQKYYEHMLINPFLKVPPTKCCCVTFVRFFVSPLKDIGEAFGEFLRALLIDLPITLYPIAIAAVTIFFFLFLFMWMGYSIRLPFFLSIEPGQTAVAGGDTQEALEGHSKEIQNQIKAVQDAVLNQEQKVMERIMHMEKVQMAAIEFGASIQQHGEGDGLPPTLPARGKSSLPRQMSIKSSEQDIEKSLSSTCSGGSAAEHCAKIENVDLKSPIPCPEVADSENWTQITTDDIIKDGNEASTPGPVPGGQVVTLKPAGIQNTESL
ncbi:uncharacterized protein [Argopecten irradians]|uniref:uncharacterized protein n=1 Tax=Argopecten irradians TaxID=31199 RepID=UPI00371DDC41